MISLFFIGAAVILNSARADRSSCFEIPNRVCAFFESRSKDALIHLPDGTFTINPLFRVPAPADVDVTAATAVKDELTFKDENILGELMSILDVPALSMRSKLKISLNVQELFQANGGDVILPNPLAADRPSIQLMSQADAMRLLDTALGPKRLGQLRDLVSRTETRIAVEGQRAELMRQNPAERAKREEYAARAKDPRRTAARERHVAEIFERAKARIIEVVAGGVERAKLDAEHLNLVKRLELVKFNVISPAEASQHPTCVGLNVNAFQSRETEEIRLCPGVLWEPDEKIKFILGHELGHPVDRCALQNDIARLDPVRVEAMIARKKITAAVGARLREFIARGDEYLSAGDAQWIDDLSTRKQLEDEGALKVLIPRAKTTPTVITALYGCLADRYQFRLPTGRQREERLRQVGEQLRDFGGLGADRLADAQRRLRAYVEAHPDCPVGRDHHQSHMNEGLSDAFGALVKDDLGRATAVRSEAAVMTSFMFAAEKCTRKLEYTAPDVSPGEVLDYVHANQERFDDEHQPPDKRTVLQVDLPGLAAAAGCKRDGAGCFDHLAAIKASGARGQSAGTTR